MKGAHAFSLFAGALEIGDLDFQPFRDGVQKARLFFDPSDGAEVAVLRYAPGAAVPRHRHAGREFLLVLEGSQEDEDGVYAAGSFVVNHPGTSHQVRSEDGCVVLAYWASPVQFVD